MKRLLAVFTLVFAALGATTGVTLADVPHQEALVSDATGGGLISDNGLVEWQIPPGVGADLRVRYTPQSINAFPPLPSNDIFVEPPFTLGIENLDGGGGVTLDKPTTLIVHYNPADLGGRSESTLRVAMRPVSAVDWNDLPSTIDTVNHIVVTHVTDPGDYGLLASNVAPASAAPAPATTVSAPGGAPVSSAPTSSTISGRVFYDKVGNGVMDGSDFPIAKAGLKISSGTFSAFTTTDDNGNYSFGGLGVGSYKVELVVGPEWAFTTPNAVGGISVTGQPDSRGAADFGMWYKLQ